MRALSDVPLFPRGWWARCVLWAFGSWTLAASAAPLYAFAHALPARGPIGALRVTVLDFAIGLSGAWVLLCAVVAAVLFPLLLGWGVFGPWLRSGEQTWAGVAVGTGLLAAVALRVGLSFFGPPGAVALRVAWLVAWGALLLPRALCPALRPGAFAPAEPVG